MAAERKGEMLCAGCLKSCILLCRTLGKGISSAFTDPVQEMLWSCSLSHSVGRGREVLVGKLADIVDVIVCDIRERPLGGEAAAPGGMAFHGISLCTRLVRVTLQLFSLFNNLCVYQATALGIKCPKTEEKDLYVDSTVLGEWRWILLIIIPEP